MPVLRRMTRNSLLKIAEHRSKAAKAELQGAPRREWERVRSGARLVASGLFGDGVGLVAEVFAAVFRACAPGEDGM
jgi:hypothetical protein